MFVGREGESKKWCLNMTYVNYLREAHIQSSENSSRLSGEKDMCVRYMAWVAERTE